MASKDIPLSRLKDDEITISDVQRLKDAGYTNVRQIAFEKKRVLVQMNGLNEAKVTKLMDKANNLIAECFKTGLQVEKERRETRKISTGCSSLDKLLNGGITLGSITEIFGESGCGKSQICLSLSVNCQIPDYNRGVEGKALYVYTEADFPSGRLVDISKKYRLEENKVRTNVTTIRALSSEHMMQVLSECGQLLLKSTYDLLIVDSIMHLLILDYPHQDGIGKRQSKLLQLMKELVRLASQHNIGVIVTNGVYLDLYVKGGNKQFPIKPYGGNVMEHLSNTRIFLGKSDRDIRVCKLWKSSNLPATSASLIITEFGIEDISDNCVRQQPRMSALGDNGSEEDGLSTDETELDSLSGYASNGYEDVEGIIMNDLQNELSGTAFKYMKKYQRVLNNLKEKEVEKLKKEAAVEMNALKAEYKVRVTTWEQQRVQREKAFKDTEEQLNIERNKVEKLSEQVTNEKRETEAIKKKAQEELLKAQQATSEIESKFNNFSKSLDNFKSYCIATIKGLNPSNDCNLSALPCELSFAVGSTCNGTTIVEDCKLTAAAFHVDGFASLIKIFNNSKGTNSLLYEKNQPGLFGKIDALKSQMYIAQLSLGSNFQKVYESKDLSEVKDATGLLLAENEKEMTHVNDVVNSMINSISNESNMRVAHKVFSSKVKESQPHSTKGDDTDVKVNYDSSLENKLEKNIEITSNVAEKRKRKSEQFQLYKKKLQDEIKIEEQQFSERNVNDGKEIMNTYMHQFKIDRDLEKFKKMYQDTYGFCKYKGSTYSMVDMCKLVETEIKNNTYQPENKMSTLPIYKCPLHGETCQDLSSSTNRRKMIEHFHRSAVTFLCTKCPKKKYTSLNAFDNHTKLYHYSK